jgi:tripartite-type tricarboxylate transporter receptor subunit TctC
MNPPARRRLLVAALAAVAAPLRAQTWPDRPIRFVVPFGPGGANDLIARAAADGVGRVLGRTVIVENKPGAGAVIGTDHVAKSRPDGSTFLVGAAGVATNGFLYRKLPYSDADLVPVGMIAVAPSVIVVHPSVPAGNLAEFIAWARAAGWVT